MRERVKLSLGPKMTLNDQKATIISDNVCLSKNNGKKPIT